MQTATAPLNLNYELNISPDGCVRSEAQIRAERIKLGYCPDCRGQQEPVQLFQISTPRCNPLWSSRKALTVEGLVFNGQCLRCYPNLDPNRRAGRRTTNPGHPTSHNNLRPSSTAQALQSPGSANVHGGRSPTNHEFANHSREPEPIITATVTLVDDAIASPSVRSSQPSRNSGNTPATHPTARNARTSARAALAMPEIFVPAAEERSMASSGSRGTESTESSASRLRRSVDRRETSRPSTQQDQECSPVQSNNFQVDEDEDDLDTIINNFQRRSSVRPVGQSSVSNLVLPPEDGSSVLPRLLRSCADNSTNQDRARIQSNGNYTNTASMSSSSSQNINHPRHNAQSSTLQPRSSFVPPSSNSVCSNTSSRHATSTTATSPTVPAVDPSERSSSERSLQSASVPSIFISDYDEVLSNLTSLVLPLADDGSHDWAVDQLLQAMKDHCESAQVQAYCLSVICDLCLKYKEFKAIFVCTVAPDDVLKSMEKHMDIIEIQENACRVLWALSDCKEHRLIVIRAGGIARLVKCLSQHREHETVMSSALGCLRCMSPESEFREAIRLVEGAKHICAVMKAHPDCIPIQKDCCAILSNIAVDLKTHQVAVVSDEEIESIVACLVNHRTDAAVSASVSFALKNLTFDERNLRKLSKFPHIIPILEATLVQPRETISDPTSQSDAEVLLVRLENFKEEEAMFEDHVVKSLEESFTRRFDKDDPASDVVDVLQQNDWSAKVTAAALECLVNLTRERLLRPETISEKTMTSIVSTVKKFPEDAVVVRWGCEFLGDIVKDDERLRSGIIEDGICAVIEDAMKKHTEDVVLHVASTNLLRILCKDSQGCRSVEQCGELFLNFTLHACSDNPTVRYNVSEIVQDLVNNADDVWGTY